jgi:phosphoribosylformylglycinamidine synthase
MTEVEIVSDRSALTAGVELGRRLLVPINHFEGNYTASPETLSSLEADGRVVLRYVGNPNGSVNDIAAVCNEGGNVVGLMPHPERATSELLGSSDGLVLLRALLAIAGESLLAASRGSSPAATSPG